MENEAWWNALLFRSSDGLEQWWANGAPREAFWCVEKKIFDNWVFRGSKKFVHHWFIATKLCNVAITRQSQANDWKSSSIQLRFAEISMSSQPWSDPWSKWRYKLPFHSKMREKCTIFYFYINFIILTEFSSSFRPSSCHSCLLPFHCYH